MVMGWITWFILLVLGWVLLIASWNSTGDEKMQLSILACVTFLAAIIINRINNLEDSINDKLKK